MSQLCRNYIFKGNQAGGTAADEIKLRCILCWLNGLCDGLHVSAGVYLCVPLSGMLSYREVTPFSFFFESIHILVYLSVTNATPHLVTNKLSVSITVSCNHFHVTIFVCLFIVAVITG